MTLSADDWTQRIKLLRLMSVEMLELAEAGGWDEVTEWEANRRTLLEELFQQAPPADLTPALEEAARAALSCDARLLELACEERDRLGDYLKSFGQGRRVRHAYQTF
ncbi:MAG: flagellar protein FliT [Candidatus Competibacteraceae bacterium]|nr:flagellar protein FliT [Candidatus Competibacteraceae bacterium]